MDLSWISDRLPTDFDGDREGDVLCLSDDKMSWYFRHHTDVRLGDYWLPFPRAPKPDLAPLSDELRQAIAEGVAEALRKHTQPGGLLS